jgi:hypothetical protein
VRTAGEAPLSFVRRPPRTKECEHDHPDRLRYTKIPLNHGSGAMAAVGFGTLIPDLLSTKQATKTALEVGFRHFDCAERYRNDPAAKKRARQGDHAAHANSSRVPLEAVGRTACRPDGANLPVSNASRNWQNYPHVTSLGSPVRRFTERATRKEHVILFADRGSRVMPDEPGPNVWG